MKFTRIAVLLFVLISSLLAAPNVEATLIPSADGKTVYDTYLHVNWLVNANLAATPDLGFVPAFSGTIAPNGSMDYSTAVRWVTYLKDNNYLGHSDWTLPTTPMIDGSCSVANGGPNGNSFGYGCMNSDMGSLFYTSLGLPYPNTAVPIPTNTVGPFSNFQPYLYWSDTSKSANGYNTFSFNTGWEGSNVDAHYMYVLPMIPGKLPGTYHASGINGLEVSDDGQTVYDPDADPGTGVLGVTWLANANLAMIQTFGAQCVNHNKDGTTTLCINPDGSMTRTTAAPVPSPVSSPSPMPSPSPNWIDGMNAYIGPDGSVGWLGQTNWQLPPTNPSDKTCTPGLGCKRSPMGELFYDKLLPSLGSPVVKTPNINVGPFSNVQPYLYWASCELVHAQSPCLAVGTDGLPAPATGFEWSFSFGNGFQGTDVEANNLYVTVYYPETPAQAADTTPPVTTAGVSGPLGNNGWYLGPAVVNFTATDDLSGVFKTEFSLNNGVTWTTGNSVSLTANGIYPILFRSTDFVGNVEPPESIAVKLDSKAPVITASANPANIFNNVRVVPVTISGTIKDNLSGVDPTTAKFVVHDEYGKVQPTGPVTLGANGAYSFTISLRTFVKKRDAGGRLYTIRVRATDNAGSARSAETTVTAKPPPPPPPPCKLGIKCK